MCRSSGAGSLEESVIISTMLTTMIICCFGYHRTGVYKNHIQENAIREYQIIESVVKEIETLDVKVDEPYVTYICILYEQNTIDRVCFALFIYNTKINNSIHGCWFRILKRFLRLPVL